MAALLVVALLLASTISDAVAARAQLRSTAAGQEGASSTSYLFSTSDSSADQQRRLLIQQRFAASTNTALRNINLTPHRSRSLLQGGSNDDFGAPPPGIGDLLEQCGVLGQPTGCEPNRFGLCAQGTCPVSPADTSFLEDCACGLVCRSQVLSSQCVQAYTTCLTSAQCGGVPNRVTGCIAGCSVPGPSGLFSFCACTEAEVLQCTQQVQAAVQAELQKTCLDLPLRDDDSAPSRSPSTSGRPTVRPTVRPTASPSPTSTSVPDVTPISIAVPTPTPTPAPTPEPTPEPSATNAPAPSPSPADEDDAPTPAPTPTTTPAPSGDSPQPAPGPAVPSYGSYSSPPPYYGYGSPAPSYGTYLFFFDGNQATDE